MIAALRLEALRMRFANPVLTIACPPGISCGARLQTESADSSLVAIPVVIHCTGDQATLMGSGIGNNR